MHPVSTRQKHRTPPTLHESLAQKADGAPEGMVGDNMGCGADHRTNGKHTAIFYHFTKALYNSIDLADGRSCSSRNRTSLRQTRLTRGRNVAIGYRKQCIVFRKMSFVSARFLTTEQNDNVL